MFMVRMDNILKIKHWSLHQIDIATQTLMKRTSWFTIHSGVETWEAQYLQHTSDRIEHIQRHTNIKISITAMNYQ